MPLNAASTRSSVTLFGRSWCSIMFRRAVSYMLIAVLPAKQAARYNEPPLSGQSFGTLFRITPTAGTAAAPAPEFATAARLRFGPTAGDANAARSRAAGRARIAAGAGADAAISRRASRPPLRHSRADQDRGSARRCGLRVRAR